MIRALPQLLYRLYCYIIYIITRSLLIILFDLYLQMVYIIIWFILINSRCYHTVNIVIRSILLCGLY